MSADPTQPLPEWRRMQGPVQPTTVIRRRRRRKGPMIALITLIVIIVLLVVSDRVANAYAENQMASQFQSSLALSGKPHVTIQGFPFWTQLIAKDFNNVDITASNETINSVTAGGGALEIASLNATLHGLHFSSFNTNSATVDQLTATALITFTALGNVGGIPQGVSITADGPNQVKATISLGPLSDSAVATITQTGPNKIHVHVNNFGGIPVDQLGNFGDFTITIPKLPPGVTIQSVSVTQQGVRVTISGHDTTLSQNS
ncbi:MAG TPA: DUF2993 domain-containing protein [Streptosporangiaceae bacterium]|nr:DUF2993 domain-containing protein [Streptosporangiaceae bacterium]